MATPKFLPWSPAYIIKINLVWSSTVINPWRSLKKERDREKVSERQQESERERENLNFK